MAKSKIAFEDRLPTFVANASMSTVHDYCICQSIEAYATAVFVSEFFVLQEKLFGLFFFFHCGWVSILGHLGEGSVSGMGLLLLFAQVLS